MPNLFFYLLKNGVYSDYNNVLRKGRRTDINICGNERYGDKRNKISAGKNNGRLKEKKDEICFTDRAWQVWQAHCNEA